RRHPAEDPARVAHRDVARAVHPQGSFRDVDTCIAGACLARTQGRVVRCGPLRGHSLRTSMADPTKPIPTSSVVGETLGEITTKRRRPEPTAIVIFGALGDLAGRKLAPAIYNLMIDGALTDP